LIFEFWWIVDRGSLEDFVNGGSQASLTGGAFDPVDTSLAVFAKEGGAGFTKFTAHKLKSIWK